MLVCPSLPVGGRLLMFVKEWEKITEDNWVLSVLKEGLTFQFKTIPENTGIKHTVINAMNQNFFTEEVRKLKEKSAIEMVPPVERQLGFYSTLFLVTKKTGDLRPVINLKPFNKFLVKKHFKMDTLAKVLNIVKPNDWAFSLDLKDAYFHVPIHPAYRKFLRFSIQNIQYQFRAMCFGPTVAPRTFTKIVSVVTAYLRMYNIRLVAYLDDWLILNSQRNMLLRDQEKVLKLLTHLGFIVNVAKSQLTPTQNVTYLGCQFRLDQGLVYPTQVRILKLEIEILHFMKKHFASAQNFLKILGIMASCIEVIPLARLHMRPVQIHVLHFWSQASKDMEALIPITQHLKDHLNWWLLRANTLKGRSLQQWCATRVLTTDASKVGFGGHLENQIFQGQWTEQEKAPHINLLELEAIVRVLNHFLPSLQGQKVLVRCDNVTVVQYINKQGGTKSPSLCMRIWQLFMILIQNNIELKAAHIAGTSNILADHLSRRKILPTEWSLNNQVVNHLFTLWGEPMIDLFASDQNHKTMIFCSWFPSQRALAIDALSISWEGMIAYAFPPISLIPRVLEHMSQFNCQLILIVPLWPRRHWYTELLSLAIDFPRILPEREDLLNQPKTKIFHPNPEIFKLSAWLLSTETSRQQAFLKESENFYLHLGEKVHKKTTLLSSENLIAGVKNGIKIPIMPL